MRWKLRARGRDAFPRNCQAPDWRDWGEDRKAQSEQPISGLRINSGNSRLWSTTQRLVKMFPFRNTKLAHSQGCSFHDIIPHRQTVQAYSPGSPTTVQLA